ncbi:MAG: trypsin-like peptidase domain-containing protein [Paracoccus sp. (in: a-proteobacteria)]|uniref:trypsin-like peptidase domain-containing protein n=1 Tax=Paracoccus sp. TaxID=267 RepID=UPI0039E39CE5
MSKDYTRVAARRLLAVDAGNERTRSVIDQSHPFRPTTDWHDTDDPRIAALAQSAAPLVARLEVGVQGDWIPIGTAWPVSAQAGRPTLRFLTAGHVLKAFRTGMGAMSHAADLDADGIRTGRVVFPDGRTHDIARWVCAALFDVAVFDIAPTALQTPPRGLALHIPASDPQRLAVIGYPLQDQWFFRSRFPNYPQARAQFLCLGGPPRPGAEPGTFLHDATTLPGCSGAPVFDLDTGLVVGLHYEGSAGGAVLAGPGSSDWNDAVANASLMEGWLGQVVLGKLGTAPHEKCHAWEGGFTPGPEEMAADLLAYAGHGDGGCVRGDGPGVTEDRADSRDRAYVPGLTSASRVVPPWIGPVGDQSFEGSCAAFALAGAIEHQLQPREGYRPRPSGFTVSVRMLDRMARRHDEWLDDVPEGTSLRAVIKGFDHNGVCPEENCPYRPGLPDFFMTREIAKQARRITLRSYLRVGLNIDDMRMAVQEAGTVIVTARIHDGWWLLDPDFGIPYDPLSPPQDRGAHAFLITGYDENGFIVQNSRGSGWGGHDGHPGLALWSFEDWAANCRDAWVIRLAPVGEKAAAVALARTGPETSPRRLRLLGHMLHAERDGLIEDGTLGLGARGVAETAAFLGSDKGIEDYPAILFLFHDPMLDEDTIARLALPLTLRLKARGVYAFHVVYGMDEMLGLRLRLTQAVAQAAARYLPEAGSRDAALMRQLRPVIRAQVEFYRQGAETAASRVLADALAVLPLTSRTRGRRLRLVSAGLGQVPAAALAQAAPEFRLPHLAIAPPLPVGEHVQSWMLDRRLRGASDLPGWRGSWADLIATAHDREIRSTSGAKAETAQDLLAATDTPTSLLRRLGLGKASARPPGQTP